jgi:hypothetical protein
MGIGKIRTGIKVSWKSSLDNVKSTSIYDFIIFPTYNVYENNINILGLGTEF